MRTPDFEAYDDFKDITGNTVGHGNTFTTSFRGLMITVPGSVAAGATFQIQHLGGSSGALQIPKTVQLHTGTNGGTIILPISGDTVVINGLTGPLAKAYALF